MDVRMPDGTIIRNVPEGTTKAELQRKLEDHGVRESAKRVRAERPTTGIAPIDWLNENAPWASDFMSGIGAATQETYLGTKDLFTDLSRHEEDMLQRADTVRGGAATAGRIFSEGVQIALPGGAAGKVFTKALPKLAGGARGVIAGDVAASAGHGALQRPGKKETRANNAASSGTAALVGGVAGKVIGDVVTGAGREIVDQTQRLAPPTGAEGGVLSRTMARLNPLKETPVSPKVKQDQWDAVIEWNRKKLQSIAPLNGAEIVPGHAGMAVLKRQFDDAYDIIWKAPVQISPATNAQLNNIIRLTNEKAGGKASKRVGQLLSHYQTRLNGNAQGVVAGRSIDDMLDELGKLAKAKAGTLEGDAYLAAARAIKAGLPGNIAQQLAVVDAKYAQYAVMRKAASYSGSSARYGGIVTPDDLRKASIAKDAATKSKSAQGAAVMQQEAAQGIDEINAMLAKDPVIQKVLQRSGALAGAIE